MDRYEVADQVGTVVIIVLAGQLKGTEGEGLFWLAVFLSAVLYVALGLESRPATKEELREMGFYLEDEIDTSHEKPPKED